MYLKSLVVFFLLFALSAADDEGSLDFRLSFNVSCANVNAVLPEALTVQLRRRANSTVQDVMEIAADADQRYKFTVTFCDFSTGYVIESLLGLPSPADDCQWFIFYQAPGQLEPQYQEGAGISFFVVKPNSTLVLSYEQEPFVPPAPSPSPTPAPPDNGNGAPTSHNKTFFVAILVSVVAVIACFL